MTRLSMNEMTTFRWSFEQDVSEYSAAGISAMGVWRRKLSDFGDERGVELLADSGMQVSNLLWAGGFTGSDGRSQRDSIDDAAEAVRLAAELRAGCLVVYSGGRAGHTHNHARRLLKDALREILPLADELAVTLAIEPMHLGCAAEWTFLTSVDEALALINELGSTRLKLAFDTYQFGQEEKTVARLGSLVEHIAIVHLGDGRSPPESEQNRARLGEGSVPLKRIITALSMAGYEGYYDVELLGAEIEVTDYRELIEQSKQAFAQLCACAVV
jgi:sugar phosphate isomerase/epimerase